MKTTARLIGMQLFLFQQAISEGEFNVEVRIGTELLHELADEIISITAPPGDKLTREDLEKGFTMQKTKFVPDHSLGTDYEIRFRAGREMLHKVPE